MRTITRLLAVCIFQVVPSVCMADEKDGSSARSFFSDTVRPILAHRCFKCHGPDEKARKGKLRLDTRAGALNRSRSDGFVIVPGKPEDSELVRRIFSTDETEMMPPPHAKNALTETEKQSLRRWIARGAEYTTHWAFVPPRQAPLPPIQQKSWLRNPIDAFVLAKLEAQGLRPSPEANRYTLIRRLYLDLIGLPPTPEEADNFAQNTSPNAYESLVDRLLASPHYGERWARRWLDLARYADTNGYEKDRPRSIWPYRDWVIHALNADMPFDRFTIEQLAGDLLPKATQDQRIATGFHRNSMLNEEGGIDPLEFRFYALVDRINTTATVWLGLTLGCAQCHTHKYDPIPQREYYRLLAFLNNTEEPEMEVRRPDITARRKELRAKIDTLEADLPNRFPPGDDKDDRRPVAVRRSENLERSFNKWLKQEAARSVHWTVLRPVEAKANLPYLNVQKDGSVFASGDQSKSDIYTLNFRTDLRGITAFRLEVLPDERLPRGGPGRIYYEGPFGDFCLSEITLTASGKSVPFVRASNSFARSGFTAAAAIDGNPQTGWSIDGGQGKSHVAVFNLAAPIEGPDLTLRLLFEQYYPVGLGRFRISATTDSRSDVASNLSAELEELLVVPSSRRTNEQKRHLMRYFLRIAPELKPERTKIEELRQQIPAYPTTLVMAERPAEHTRSAFIHNRGEFLQPAERVEPGVLSVLPPLPKEAPRNRLTLAHWLVTPENPLVGRVTVNRQWAAFFGRGLVRTVQDFGYQGASPTHAPLLDWLAVEFVRRGWSMKALHRLIVMSATYRQSSRVTLELLSRDPENDLLARGPLIRLEAEQVRDAALGASGLLSLKIGGPSVFPPQPANVTTEGAYGELKWEVSKGPDRYRRGLYTFSKRTTPFAMALTFDAPSGEVCVAYRETSNTSLQALTLLNDPVFTEVAQALGRATAAEKGTIQERAAWLFRRCLTRPPETDELSRIVRFYEIQKQRFKAGQQAIAADVAGPGTGDVNERAAWTALARALLNLDEVITRG